MKKVTHPVESLFATRADGDRLSFLSPEQQMAPISSLTLQQAKPEASYRKAPSLALLNQYFSAPGQRIEGGADVLTEISVIDEAVSEDSNILKQLGILAEDNVQNDHLLNANVQLSRCVSYGNSHSENRTILTNKAVGHKPLSLWNIKILWQKFLVRWF